MNIGKHKSTWKKENLDCLIPYIDNIFESKPKFVEIAREIKEKYGDDENNSRTVGGIAQLIGLMHKVYINSNKYANLQRYPYGSSALKIVVFALFSDPSVINLFRGKGFAWVYIYDTFREIEYSDYYSSVLKKYTELHSDVVTLPECTKQCSEDKQCSCNKDTLNNENAGNHQLYLDIIEEIQVFINAYSKSVNTLLTNISNTIKNHIEK